MARKNFQVCSMEELTQLIINHLANKDIQVVLVGGMAVSLYTNNSYLTKDIDMIDISYQGPQSLRAAMSEIGFQKKGKNYINSTTDIQVEFPSGQLSVGDELVTETTLIKGKFGDIPVLQVKDVVKDRLSLHYHWDDPQGLVQALAVTLNHKLDPKELRGFITKEANKEGFQEFEENVKELSKRNIFEMADIENYLVEKKLAEL